MLSRRRFLFSGAAVSSAAFFPEGTRPVLQAQGSVADVLEAIVGKEQMEWSKTGELIGFFSYRAGEWNCQGFQYRVNGITPMVPAYAFHLETGRYYLIEWVAIQEGMPTPLLSLPIQVF